jgi:hypothetical protein
LDRGLLMQQQNRQNKLSDYALGKQMDADKAPGEFLQSLQQQTPEETLQEGVMGPPKPAEELGGEQRLIKLVEALAKTPQAAQALTTVAKFDPVLGPELKRMEAQSELQKAYSKLSIEQPFKAALKEQDILGKYVTSTSANQQKYQLAKDLWDYKQGGPGKAGKPSGIASEIKYMLDQFGLPWTEENVQKVVKIRRGDDIDTKVLMKAMDAVNKQFSAGNLEFGPYAKQKGEANEAYEMRIDKARRDYFEKIVGEYQSHSGKRSGTFSGSQNEREDFDAETVDEYINDLE